MKKPYFNSKPFNLRDSEFFLKAVKFNNYQIVEQALHKSNSYLYEYDYYKQTAFHWAAKLGNLKILKLLIQNGKCLNQYDLKLRTPLYLAALNNQKEAVKMLLENGGNPQIADVDGNKPVDVTTDEDIKKEIYNYLDKLYGNKEKKGINKTID